MSLESPYFYLTLMILTLLGPLTRSFETKVAYYKSFKSLFTSIGITMLVFIPWDVAFTEMGIWGFNPKYLTGFYIFGLPIEEWMFFVFVPFSCVFIYRVMDYFFPRAWITQGQAQMLTQYFAWLSIAIAILSWGAWYTVSTFSLLGLLMLSHVHLWKVEWLPSFYRAFVIVLIPFGIVNGFLTGMGLEEEVVWYNDAHNLGYRLGTIPADDVFYAMALLMMNTSLYEYFRKRWETR